MKKNIAKNELNINSHNYSLLTDLYQLTMAACYAGEGIATNRASFELFTRHLPDNFGYLIAMGLAQVLDYLEQLSFNSEQIKALQQTKIFDRAPRSFWQLLESCSFTGNVWAVPEGTAVFANEPILRIEAPLWQAQLVETYILNTINYQTLIATKAARIRDVAGIEANILEFGTRRAFSPQGALWAARAALAAGFDGTSNVLAALELGEQPRGTMAHALIMAIAATRSEDEAFTAFQHYFPQATLLIDTYDTIAAAKRLQDREINPLGVRIDSGDLVELSQQVHSYLPETKIVASGDLDEWEIERLQQQGAILHGYGIGTRLVTGEPVNGVYKLVEIDRHPTMKESAGKLTYPGCKQIFRTAIDGKLCSDRLGLHDESPRGDERGLLEMVMQHGNLVTKPDSIKQIRQRTAAAVASLPNSVRRISQPASFAVDISPALERLRQSVTKNTLATTRSR